MTEFYSKIKQVNLLSIKKINIEEMNSKMKERQNLV